MKVAVVDRMEKVRRMKRKRADKLSGSIRGPDDLMLLVGTLLMDCCQGSTTLRWLPSLYFSI